MPRTVEDRQQKLIIGLKAARRMVLDAVAMLPDERLDEVFLGDWSVKDLIAHLVGWDFPFAICCASRRATSRRMPCRYALSSPR